MTDQNHTTRGETQKSRRPSSTGVLWASAFLLMGMILTQAGRSGLENTARADVSEVGDLTIATMKTSDGSEPIAILSRRSERVLFYGIQNGRELKLLGEPVNLPDAFTKARTLATNNGR